MSIPKKEILSFTQQFANLIEAGLPLRKSIQILAQQQENPEFVAVIQGLNEHIENGNSLSQAFGFYPQIFSKFYISMVYAGESGAGLTKALKEITANISKEEELSNSVKKAFTYPIMLISLASLMVVFMVLVIVPVFQGVYKSMGVELPLPTQIIVVLSVIARQYWLIVFGLIIAFVAVYQTKLKKSEEFKGMVDHAFLNAPLIGKLFKKLAAVRFISALSDLLVAGVPILETLEIAGKVSNNTEVNKISEKIRKSIEGGGTISKPLEECEFFPPIVVQMAYAGEESGTLGDMLKKCSGFLEFEVNNALAALVTVLEPMITLGVGAVIGFIMMAVYLPMFDMVKMVGK